MRKRRTLTDEQRRQRRDRDRERLEQAARQLLSTEGWRRWVRVRASNGLSRYSFGNQLLIAIQRPDATYVAGFKALQTLGHRVRKGEKAIWILAPNRVKERDADGKETSEVKVFFRSVPVFDVAQTEPIDGVEVVDVAPPRQPITGSSHAHLLPQLGKLAAELGYAVRDLPLSGRGDGWCDPDRREIVINDHLARNAQVRVLVHEIAHALGVSYTSYGRERAEVLVDTVTYIVCRSVGLDVSGEAIPYVAGWGEDGALDAIRDYAETIDTIAGRIEAALTGGAADACAGDAALAA